MKPFHQRVNRPESVSELNSDSEMRHAHGGYCSSAAYTATPLLHDTERSYQQKLSLLFHIAIMYTLNDNISSLLILTFSLRPFVLIRDVQCHFFMSNTRTLDIV